VLRPTEDVNVRNPEDLGSRVDDARQFAAILSMPLLARALLSSPAESSVTTRKELFMSSEMQGDAPLDLAAGQRGFIGANHDASDARAESPERAHDSSHCLRLCGTAYEGSNYSLNAPHFIRIEGKSVQRQPLTSPQPRDWKNVSGPRNIEDRRVAIAESQPWQTAGSALKSILKKHHARVRLGHDRILDLRDF
jgi:hypothetical protein